MRALYSHNVHPVHFFFWIAVCNKSITLEVADERMDTAQEEKDDVALYTRALLDFCPEGWDRFDMAVDQVSVSAPHVFLVCVCVCVCVCVSECVCV